MERLGNPEFYFGAGLGSIISGIVFLMIAMFLKRATP